MIDRIKTILLSGLMLLTVFLTLRVWLYDPSLLDSPSMAWAAPLRPLLGFGTPAPSDEQVPALELRYPCAWPSIVAVNSGGSRLGAWHSARETDALAALFGDMLREALGTAGTLSAVSKGEWFEALGKDCVYIEYEVALPLGVLAAWVSGSCSVDTSVRALALCVVDDKVELWYREEPSGRYFMVATGAAPDMPDISAVNVLPCYFAFERPGAVPGAPDAMLIMEETSSPASAISSQADAVLFCEPFLKELQMVDGNWYEVPEGRVYVDDLRTCRVFSSGLIAYRNPEAEGNGSSVDVVKELEQARGLLAVLSRALGDARWGLSGMVGGIYSFTAQIDGISVTGGAYATIEFAAGEIRSADITLRQYALADVRSVILPVRQAVALMPPDASRLGLCFPDTGDGITAQWWVE